MHWFQRMTKLAKLAGEWWIIDGDVMFADGDVGEVNHEGMVVDHIKRQYADDRFDRGEYVDWDAFEASLLAQKVIDAGLDLASLDDRSKYNLILEALTELGMTQDEISIVRESHSNIDPRDWGLKHLGWKRVKGRSVDTWTLTAGDLASIARGLGEAYADVEEPELVFDINVVSTRTLYEDVPIAVIELNTPDELLPYGRRY